MGDRRPRREVLRILPRRFPEPRRLKQCEVRGEPEAVPVGDVALRDRGLEALRLRDRPVRQEASAAAARDAEATGVHVAAPQHLVDAGHQILVVVAGVVILDDVPEILPVRRAAARIREQHDIALRCHPLELVRVGIAVGRMRTAVDFENQGVLPGRFEVRRLQNPRLNLLPVERSIPDLFRLALLDVFEEVVVDVRNRIRLKGSCPVQNRKISDVRLGRKRRGDPRSVGRRAVRNEIVRAVGQRLDLAGRDRNALQVRAAFLRRDDDQRLLILRPEDRLAVLSARRRLVPADAARDVEVIVGGQVLRRAARRVDDPQVRLAVGTNRFAAKRADEGDPFAVGRQRQVADSAFDARELLDRAARRRHGIELVIALVVVRLRDAGRREVDRGAVAGPCDVALVVIAVGNLFGCRGQRSTGVRPHL